MQSINLPSKPPSSPHPILNLSFRIFFSAGALFAIITMALWAFVFTGHTDIDAQTLNPLYWHGHEMIYGYALAIVAGFLLTAVKTWTGVMMPHGYKLLGIFVCWLLARLGWVGFGLGITIAGSSAALLYAAAVFDLLFIGSMAFVIFRAVLQVKQYKQMGILAKLALLTVGNALCYWGIISANMNLTKVGVYLGFYLIIGLVLTIGRRVVPFFIERGLSVPNAQGETEAVTVRNNKAQDIASLLFFFAFFILNGHFNFFAGGVGFGHLGTGAYVDACFFKGARQLLGDFVVLYRHNVVHKLDQCYLGADGAVEVSKFAAYGT